MLVFGVDVPLVEIVIGLALVTFILLAEAIIIVSLQIRQLNRTKKLVELVEKLSQTVLQMKKSETEQLDRMKRL